MMDLLIIILASIFLPLFPMSMVFNSVLENVKQPWLRVVLFIAWPLIGLFILSFSDADIPVWVLIIALITSTLYALRMLSLREVNQWNGFLATSLWSLLWLAITQDTASTLLYSYAFSMSVPLALLVILSAGLEQRFGAAYTDLYGGLAQTIPCFAWTLVTVVVAAIATPLFPTFFIMFDMIVESITVMPLVAVALMLIWILWSWAGARLIQGLIVGRRSNSKVVDLNGSAIGFYSSVLVALMAGGIYLGGVIL